MVPGPEHVRTCLPPRLEGRARPSSRSAGAIRRLPAARRFSPRGRPSGPGSEAAPATYGEGVTGRGRFQPGADDGSARPRVRTGPSTPGAGPSAEGAKKVLEQSLRIALGRKDNHIGTLHLLLAL
ncbi:hypothetical protein ACFW9N_43155, partial [Streptomyces sp. NPDC059496]